jgi:hypothetical protein
MQQQMQREEHSIGELFSQLAADTGILIRQEVSLAETELTRKASKAGKDVGALVIGGAVGYAGLLAVIAGVIMALSYIIPAWLSALLVGAAIGGGAYMMITSALEKLKRADLKPRETVESIKEDAEWLKNQLK